MAENLGGAIASLNANVLAVHRELRSFEQSTMQSFASVDQKQNILENELKDFYSQFLAFVKADLMQKRLQLAETRVGNLRQDLQIKYGYYAEIRRMANGILQGVDAGIISEETIKSMVLDIFDFDFEGFNKKLESYDHQEYNLDWIKNTLEVRMENGQDFVGRPNDWKGNPFSFRIDESDLPRYILENRDRYSSHFK